MRSAFRFIFELVVIGHALVAPSWAIRTALVAMFAAAFWVVPAVDRLQHRGILPVPLASLFFPHVPACQFAPCPRLGWYRDPIDGTRLCHEHTTTPGDQP